MFMKTLIKIVTHILTPVFSKSISFPLLFYYHLQRRWIVMSNFKILILGLDESIAKYANSFLNNGVKGYQLLNLRADDLDHFGVESLGHQEVLLESVGYLRSFVSLLIFSKSHSPF